MKSPIIHFPFNGNFKNVGTLYSPVTVYGDMRLSREFGGCANSPNTTEREYVSYAYRPELALRDFTISAWAWMDFDWTSNPVLIETDSSTGIYIYVNSSSNRFYAYVCNGEIVGDANHLVNTKTWVHLSFSRRSDLLTAYFNGRFSNSITRNATQMSSTNDIYLFDSVVNVDWNEDIMGKMKDFRIYDYALSPAQIAHIYNGIAKDKANV